MKKQLFTVLLVLSMLVMFVGTVGAAPMGAGTAALTEVEYVPGKGPVFTFNVSGKFSRSELKGSLHVEGGADYGLHCTQVDGSTVKCSSSAKVSDANVVLTWGGSTFWTYVPEAPVFCYGIFDWNSPPPVTAWQLYGTHCQETAAHYGDSISWDNPYWGESPYVFLPFSPNPGCFAQDVSGDAYYYPSC